MKNIRKAFILTLAVLCVISNANSYALRTNSLFDEINRDKDAERVTTTAEDYIKSAFPSIGALIAEHDKKSQPTKLMRFDGLYEVIFNIARDYKGRRIKAVLMGPGSMEFPENVYSSPQTVEFLAVLNYGQPERVDLEIVDKSEKILAMNAPPQEYVSSGATVRYSGQMKTALSMILGQPEQSYNIFRFKVEVPKNIAITTHRADFKDFDYGADGLDLILATAVFDKVLSGMSDLDFRLAFIAKLINGLKPGGRLLIDVDSLFFVVPEDMLDYVAPELKQYKRRLIKRVDGMDRETRFGLTHMVNFLEDSLFQRYGISAKAMFYREAVEITRLASGAEISAAADMASREMDLPEGNAVSLYNIDFKSFKSLGHNL